NNNCGFVSQGQLQELTNRVAQVAAPTGTNSLNGQTGVVSLQGSANQIMVSASAGVVTLSAPQDISAISSPTFANLLLTGSIDIGGIINTSLDCSANLNGGKLTIGIS